MLYKNRNFQKPVSKLSKDELSSQMEQLDILSKQVTEIFILLPLSSIPSAVLSDLQVIQTCLRELRSHIKQYEDLNLPPVNPFASGTSISPPPQWTEEDFLQPESSSPQFEPSPEQCAPASPVFSRSNSNPSRVLPDPTPSQATAIKSKTKFVFKKPATVMNPEQITRGSGNTWGGNSSIVTPSMGRTSIKNNVTSTVSGGDYSANNDHSFVFNDNDFPESKRGSSRGNNYNSTGFANSWTGAPQFIEDFQTQEQGDNINYTN